LYHYTRTLLYFLTKLTFCLKFNLLCSSPARIIEQFNNFYLLHIWLSVNHFFPCQLTKMSKNLFPHLFLVNTFLFLTHLLFLEIYIWHDFVECWSSKANSSLLFWPWEQVSLKFLTDNVKLCYVLYPFLFV